LNKIQGITIDDIKLGDQIITYDCVNNPSCNTSDSDITYDTIYNVLHESNLEDYIKNNQ